MSLAGKACPSIPGSIAKRKFPEDIMEAIISKGPFTYYVVGLGGGGGQTKYFKILRGEGGGPGI